MQAFVRGLWKFFASSQVQTPLIPVKVSGVDTAVLLSTPIQPRPVQESAVPMMASVSARAAVMIKPHVPMIRFRYRNGLPNASKNNSTTTQRPQSTERAGGPSQPKGSGIPAGNLPARFRRRSMSQEEMDSVNTGGVAAEVVKPAAGKPKPR